METGGQDRLDPELASLEGEALLGEVRARVSDALRGRSGRAYEASLAALSEPMRVVHAVDLLASSLATGRRAASDERGAVDRRIVERGVEALVALGMHADAEAIAGSLEPGAQTVDRARVADLAELVDARGEAWNDVLVAFVEARRTYVH